MRSPHRAAGLAASALVAVLLAGCSQFNAPPTGAQQDVIGKARVSVSICSDGFGDDINSSGPATPSPCDDATPSTTRGFPEGQLLLGFLVPDGADAPATLGSPDLEGVVFGGSAEYAAELERLQNAPAGQHWVGYMSDVIDAGVRQTVRLDADFALPPGASGAPFAGPFVAQVVLGDRMVAESADPALPNFPADRPVNCDESEGGNPVTTACVEDTGEVTVATRDLALRPAGVASGKQGAVITVPFTAQFAGAAGDEATFAMTAITDAPGATAAPASASLTPTADSTTPQSVDVTIPSGTPAGTYSTTLTATVAGQQRTATANFTVATVPQKPQPIEQPQVQPLPKLHHSLGIRRPGLRALATRGVPVTVGCNQRCTSYIDLLYRIKKGARKGTTLLVGRMYVNHRKAGKRTVRLKLFPQYRPAVGHVNRFTLYVRTTAADARGGQRGRAHVETIRFRGVCVPGKQKRCVRNLG